MVLFEARLRAWFCDRRPIHWWRRALARTTPLMRLWLQSQPACRSPPPGQHFKIALASCKRKKHARPFCVASIHIGFRKFPNKNTLFTFYVVSHEIHLSEKAAARVVSKVARSTRTSGGFSVEGLTDREIQVFELIGAGQSTRQIAIALHINASTVETYRSRIKDKLNLKNAIELLQCAIRWSNDPKY